MNDIERLGQPRTSSQATLVEQARVVAETEGKVFVAQQRPRNEELARQRILKACAEPRLAERAFFRYARAGSTITGPSIHLAREIARCWGNVMYGIVELRRDDVNRESEMRAAAWDLETNTESSTTFIVKHQRDANGRTVDLTSGRDVYENNANQGARRTREMIFAIVPSYIVEEAKEACMDTLTRSETPLPDRIERAVKWFADIDVTVQILEAKLGSRRHQWRHLDIAALEIVVRSLTQGETTVADEFPVAQDQRRVDPAAIAAQASAPAAAPPQTSGGGASPGPTSGIAESASPGADSSAGPASDPPPSEPEPISEAQFAEIGQRLADAGVDRTGAVMYLNDVLKHHGVDKTVRARKELTGVEAEWVLASLRADGEPPEHGDQGGTPEPRDPAVEQPADPWAKDETDQPLPTGDDQ